MKKAHVDENNKLLGWYDTEIHTVIPEQNIDVTDEQWQNSINNNHNKVNADGSTESFDFRTEAERLAEEKAATDYANLKASAKAKLIAGEPLTEEEADTIVL